MNILEQYGWNTYFDKYHSKNNTNSDVQIGRIISVQSFKYQLITSSGERNAELSGKMIYGVDEEQVPVVGDWVYFLDYDTMGYIVDLLPRFNALSRRSPGNRSERQVLAANIDVALVVQGLDRDFNLMRIDRYLVQISSCGIRPVLVLNKADLITNRDFYTYEVARLGRRCPVYFCSTYDQSGLDELYNTVFKPWNTLILVGSSGAGKSSLINALMHEHLQKTGSISEYTQKGRHVTTTRHLFRLENGSMVIDTPGMREFGIALDDTVSAPGLFPEIEKYAMDCRYSDCQHVSEEGCGVIRAFHEGRLDPKVYASYLKLVREQKHFEIRIEDRKRLGKQFGKMVKEAKAFRNKYKF